MRLVLTLIALAVCLVSSGLLFGGTACTCRLRTRTILAFAGVAVAAYTAVLVVRPQESVLSNTSALLVALFLGSLLGSLVKSPAALISFCIAAAIADVVSFEVGVTAKLIQAYHSNASNVFQYLCLSVPVHGHQWPVVGIGDLLVLTVIFFTLHCLGHRSAVAFAAPVTGLLLAVVIGMLVGGIFAIPFVVATTVTYLWFVSAHGKVDA